MATVRIITPPAEEPVSVSEALAHTGVPDTEANRARLQGLIAVAREVVEAYTERALITQARALILDRLPSAGWLGLHALAPRHNPPESYVELPGGRIQEVSGVYLLSPEGEEEVDTAIYEADLWREPGRLALRSGHDWPRVPRQQGARVEYVAGYGEAPANVPAPIRQAVLLSVAGMVSRRDPTVQSERVGNASVVYVQSQAGGGLAPNLPPEVRALLEPYRLARRLT